MKNIFHLIITAGLVSTFLVCCQSQEEKKQTESLYGKQIVAIGNSITAPKDSWAWITAQHFDMELTNLAVSGAQWTDYQGTTVDTNPKPVYDGVHTNNVISNQVYRFLQLIVPEGEIISEAEREKFHTSTPAPLTGLKTKNSTFDPTIVIISCGTNDSSNGKPIGDPSELDKPYQEADRKTLYGAINWAVSIIRKYSPDTEIVLLTPIQRSSHSQKLPMFVDAILLAGEKLNCPAINMYEESGITEAVEAKEHKYLYDGLHPNALGQQLMGEVVIKHLIDLYENKQ